MTSLVDKLLAVHHGLETADLPHAFGGAIALAYYTEDPRGTRDIDVNVFTPARHPTAALRALPSGIVVPRVAAATLRAEGQIRLWWDDTPVDLFLDYAPLHDQARAALRSVPFAGEQIPVLGPLELCTFKALFDRPKDWVDITAVLGSGALAVAELRAQLVSLLGESDARLRRLDQLA